MLDIHMKKDKGQTNLRVYKVPLTKLDLFTYILVLSMEQKIFRVPYQQMTDFILKKGYICTSVQKGGFDGFPQTHDSCDAVLQGHS